jgi:peroxiredoxin
MEPIGPGSPAPPIEGTDLEEPRVLFFYKVTCPVCQLAAPVAERMQAAYPGRIVGVGQDDETKLRSFAAQYGATFPSAVDEPPYPASRSYGVRVVPTLFLVQEGVVRDVVESWDRDGFNRIAQGLAELTGNESVALSTPDDGLPPFRPG